MATPYLPPEITINILDHLYLDDLLLRARLVSRMWNIFALATAKMILRGWHDKFCGLQPVEVELLFHRRLQKVLKHNSGRTVYLPRPSIKEDGVVVRTFYVNCREGVVARGFHKCSLPIVKSVLVYLHFDWESSMAETTYPYLCLRFKNNSYGKLLSHKRQQRFKDLGIWTFMQEMELDRTWIDYGRVIGPEERAKWAAEWIASQDESEGEEDEVQEEWTQKPRNTLVLPPALLKQFDFKMAFTITYQLDFEWNFPAHRARECEVLSYSAELQVRRVRSESGG